MERDPDADASETKEGRAERKYRFTARNQEGKENTEGLYPALTITVKKDNKAVDSSAA